jgi:iron complex outermembrane receptor protein
MPKTSCGLLPRAGLTAAALVALGAGWSMPAAAQQAPAGSAASRGELEEIVVTARRREELLQAIPVSVTAISGERLQEQHIQTLQSVQNYVPSLNISSNNTRDANNFNLRGAGTTYQADPAVVAYFAEVPMAFNGGGPGFYYDLENMQVLKGPQGTLFGRNAVGGAVLFTPKKPTNDWGGYASLDVGNFSNVEMQGALNAPIVKDKLAIRVSGNRRTRDGFTKEVNFNKDYDNVDYWAARVSALLTPSDSFENYLLFNSVYNHNNGTSALLTDVNPAGPARLIFGPALDAALAQQNALGPRKTFMTPESIYRIWNWQVTDVATWNLNDTLTVKNIFGYQGYSQVNRLDVGGTTLPILYYKNTGQYGGVLDRNSPAFHSLTEELQFSGKALGGKLQWVAGGYYERDRPYGSNLTNQIVFGNSIFTSVTKGTTSKALYAQGDLDLSAFSPALDGFTFTGGYRYTWDHRTGYQNAWVAVTPSFNVCQYVGTYPNCAANFSKNFKKGTYTLALKYQMTPGTQAYVTGRTGFKSGGFNVSAPPNSPLASFGPENSTDVEIGLKSDFNIGGMKARTNLAAFHTDYKNIDRALVYSINGQVGAFVQNATSARIRGFEFEGTLIPTRGLEIGAFYSLLDTKYGQYVTAQGDFSGQVLPYVSKHKFGVNARQFLPMPESLGELSVSASYFYQTRFKNLDNNDPGIFLPAYGLLNVNLDWNGIGGSNFDAGLYMTNALNKLYKIGQGSYYTSLGVVTTTYGEPRMYGVRLRYKFGE